MSLKTVTDTILSVARMQPTVNAAFEGDIYDIMGGNPSQKYATVVLTQTQHQETEMFMRYNFTIFYVDRLVDNLETNRLQIQSTGIDVLSNILRYIVNQYDWEIVNKTYNTFTEKFPDETAGCFADIVLEVPLDYLCSDDDGGLVPTLEINENGIYEINGMTVKVDIGG